MRCVRCVRYVQSHTVWVRRDVGRAMYRCDEKAKCVSLGEEEEEEEEEEVNTHTEERERITRERERVCMCVLEREV